MFIAIVRRNGFGDVLCALPLVLWCKESLGAHVTLFIDERAGALRPYLEGPDEVVIMPQHRLKYMGLVRTAWQARKENFDLIVGAKSSPMKLMNLLLYGMGGRKRVAYVDKAWHSRLVNMPRVFERGVERHQALKCLNLLVPELEEIPKRFYPRLKMQTEVGETLFVSVTNNRLGSTLDCDKCQRVLNGQKRPFSVVVNAEPKDREKAYRLAEGLKMQSRVVITERFEEFMALLASVKAVFSGDGGVMHLAAALDKPQVVLFGGTKVWEWAPLSEKAICLSDPYNVNFISEEQIAEAVGRIL